MRWARFGCIERTKSGLAHEINIDRPALQLRPEEMLGIDRTASELPRKRLIANDMHIRI